MKAEELTFDVHSSSAFLLAETVLSQPLSYITLDYSLTVYNYYLFSFF